MVFLNCRGHLFDAVGCNDRKGIRPVKSPALITAKSSLLREGTQLNLK